MAESFWHLQGWEKERAREKKLFVRERKDWGRRCNSLGREAESQKAKRKRKIRKACLSKIFTRYMCTQMASYFAHWGIAIWPSRAQLSMCWQSSVGWHSKFFTQTNTWHAWVIRLDEHRRCCFWSSEGTDWKPHGDGFNIRLPIHVR